jgi:energy-coupling factor transporter transmembrane protein EcfT
MKKNFDLNKIFNLYFYTIFLITFLTIIYSYFREVNKYNFFILIFFNLTAVIYFLFNKYYKSKYFLIHFSLISSLFLLNFLCELFVDVKIEQEQFNRSAYYISKGWTWDDRNKKEFIEDLKIETGNKNIFTNSNYRYVIKFRGNDSYIDLDNKKYTFALSNISNSIIVQCKESGKWENWISDKHGFHNPKKIYNFENKYIALLGDSFVEGSCVKSGDDVSNQLRKMQYNVLNLGRAAGGVIYANAVYREYKNYLSTKKPDYVFLMLYGGNDLEDTYKEFQTPIIKNYFYDENYNNDLVNKQEKIDKFWKSFLNKVYSDEHYNTLKKNEKTNINNKFEQQQNSKKLIVRAIKLNFLRVNLIKLFENSIDNKKKIDVLTDSLLKIKNEIEKDSKFVVVYLPNHEELFFDKKNTYKSIIKIFEDLSINYIDALVEFKKVDYKKFYNLELPGHYNESGYNYLANIVNEYIKNRDLK